MSSAPAESNNSESHKPESRKPGCLNCGDRTPGAFCPSCGQPHEDRRGSVLSLIGVFFSELLSLDGKHLRTALNLWRPGRLTELFLAGKRVTYVHPGRVYLVTSLLFFLLVGIPAPDASRTNVFLDGEVLGRAEPDPNLGQSVELFDPVTGGLADWARARMETRFERIRSLPVQQVLDRYFGEMERTIPTALIVFVPFLALALKLLYIRQGRLYYDHVVFALHFQSFLFTILITARLFGMGSSALGFSFSALPYVFALLIAQPVYAFFAMRRVYGQGRLISFLKVVALGFLYLIVAQPVLLATVAFAFRAI